MILGGVELHRYGLMAEFRRLVEASRVPVATTLLGKTVISEHHPQAIGVYEGGVSRQEIRDIVEKRRRPACASAPGSATSISASTPAGLTAAT